MSQPSPIDTQGNVTAGSVPTVTARESKFSGVVEITFPVQLEPGDRLIVKHGLVVENIFYVQLHPGDRLIVKNGIVADVISGAQWEATELLRWRAVQQIIRRSTSSRLA